MQNPRPTTPTTGQSASELPPNIYFSESRKTVALERLAWRITKGVLRVVDGLVPVMYVMGDDEICRPRDGTRDGSTIADPLMFNREFYRDFVRDLLDRGLSPKILALPERWFLSRGNGDRFYAIALSVDDAQKLADAQTTNSNPPELPVQPAVTPAPVVPVPAPPPPKPTKTTLHRGRPPKKSLAPIVHADSVVERVRKGKGTAQEIVAYIEHPPPGAWIEGISALREVLPRILLIESEVWVEQGTLCKKRSRTERASEQQMINTGARVGSQLGVIQCEGRVVGAEGRIRLTPIGREVAQLLH